MTRLLIFSKKAPPPSPLIVYEMKEEAREEMRDKE